MSKKKYIQPQRFQTSLLKSNAIQRVKEYIESHINDFKNGEIISVEYKTENNKITDTNVVVIINGQNIELHPTVSENDTLKIVEKEGNQGLTDKNALWLSDNWDDEVDSHYDASDLRSTVREMAAELRTVRKELALCKEALTNTLGGGDILLNSTKYFLENEYEAEMPEDAQNPYTTGDTQIYSWDIYIGPTPLSEYSQGGIYSNQRYYPKARAFNSAGEEIEITSAITVTMFCGGGSAEVVLTGRTLYAITSGDTNFYATISDPFYGFTDAKTYLLTFKHNEEPSYQQYNVKHLLVKHSESVDYMMQHAAYLLVGEFCWCIKEQELYLKETAKNGTIQLFKINGQGSVTPTGETEEITYGVDVDGTLNMTATEGSVNVDEDGILNIIGTVNENGILILNDSEIDPPTPTPTGETSITAYVDRNGMLVIDSSNDSSGVDREGNLIITAQVDSGGNININNL